MASLSWSHSGPGGCCGGDVNAGLALVGDPVDVGVLALEEVVLDGKDVGAVAGELPAVAGAAHYVLGDEVVLAEVYAHGLEGQVGRVGEESCGRRADGVPADEGLGDVV